MHQVRAGACQSPKICDSSCLGCHLPRRGPAHYRLPRGVRVCRRLLGVPVVHLPQQPGGWVVCSMRAGALQAGVTRVPTSAAQPRSPPECRAALARAVLGVAVGACMLAVAVGAMSALCARCCAGGARAAGRTMALHPFWPPPLLMPTVKRGTSGEGAGVSARGREGLRGLGCGAWVMRGCWVMYGRATLLQWRCQRSH